MWSKGLRHDKEGSKETCGEKTKEQEVTDRGDSSPLF